MPTAQHAHESEKQPAAGSAVSPLPTLTLTLLLDPKGNSRHSGAAQGERNADGPPFHRAVAEGLVCGVLDHSGLEGDEVVEENRLEL